MTKQTKQTPAQSITLPDGAALEDLVAAVSRGVTEALAAQDDVSGYAFGTLQRPLILTTIVFPPPPPPPPPPPGSPHPLVGPLPTVADPRPR